MIVRNKQRATLLAASALSIGMSLSVQASVLPQDSESGFETKPCYVEGLSMQMACGTVAVPLDWAAGPEAGTIDIHVTKIPASGGKAEAEPFVMFAGGPGQAAGEIAFVVDIALREIWAKHDILLIDTRGTGKSAPMQCNFGDAISPAELRAAAADCLAEQKLDTRHFHLQAATRDVKAVFDAMGVQQAHLWGASYGTRSAAMFYRRYPEHVATMIVDGVTPPDLPLFVTTPKATEGALNALFEDCDAQPSCREAFPDLKGDLLNLLAAARGGDLRYTHPNPLTGEAQDVPVGFSATFEAIRSSLYNAQMTTLLPYTIHQAADGNLQPLFAPAYGANMGMYMGMTLSFLCSEEVDRITPEEAADAGAGTISGASYYDHWSNLCAAWKYMPNADLPQDMFEPLTGNVPTMVLSGRLDPITPGFMGQKLADSLSNAVHIDVPGTGHNTAEVSCVSYLMGEFIKNRDPQALDASCLQQVKRLPLIVGPNGQTQLVNVTANEGGEGQ